MTKSQFDELKECIQSEISGEKTPKSTSRTKKKVNQKIEFSKKIYKFGEMLVIIVTLYTMVVVWKTGDLSPLMYLIPAVFGVFGTATGFYMWKAKAENISKYAKDGIVISESLRGNE